jgi:cytochrome c peroxidase
MHARIHVLACTFAFSACGGSATAPALRVPELGPVPPLPVSADDPPSDDKIALGTHLFFDARLSGSGHSNCNGCHTYNGYFQDGLITAVPDRSYPNDRPTLTRNTLSFFNIVYAPVFRWDGSHTDLLAVLPFPFSEPNMNLGTDVPSAQAQLKQRLTTDVPGYVPLFQQAYGADLRALDPPSVWRLAGRALAAFVRKAVSRDSAFDRWNAGDDSALDASAVRGLALFRDLDRGRCILCHNGPFFTDFGFHNVSSAPPRADGTRADEGRFLVTGAEADRGAFLTPTLRGAYDTGPYFHDGTMPGIRSVLRFLSSPGVVADPNHDRAFPTPLALTDGDIDDLVEFIKALRGTPVTDITPPPDGTP